jgi:phosphoglycerate dehydrogenase-like enzyme
VNVLITDAEYPDVEAFERPMLAAAGFRVARAQCRTPEQIIAAGHDADILLAQYAPITRKVFESLPKIRIVSRYGVGVDNIDLEAAQEFGVWVANVPDYGVREVATHALGMALALVRHLLFFDKSVRDGEWYYRGTGTLRRPSDLTFGVLGHGRIGSAIAQMAAPSFRRVMACDPYLPESAWPDNILRVDHDELFRQSDVISLHVPLTDETHNMVNRHQLGQMPHGGYLVNTARGGVVNLDDLLWALDHGGLAAAALDVLPDEPPPADHPILAHTRVLLTPHSAFYSEEAEQELRRKAVQNIFSWAESGRPPYVLVEGKRGAQSL